MMRFIRARDSDTKNPRKTPMPQEIKDELAKNPEQQEAIFKLWIQHNEDFVKTVAVLTHMHRKITGSVGQERWRTWGQLVKFYGGDEEVAQAIIDDLPDSHKRKNPAALKCDKTSQYWVLLEDGRDEMDQDIWETGIQAKADVEKTGNEEFLKKAFSQPSSSSHGPARAGAKGANTPQREARDAAEKAQKKLEAEEKAKAKAQELEKNIPLRATNWLKNINSDITKLQTAIAETKKVVSKEVGCTYRNKFVASQSELFKLRTLFEKHFTALDKKTVKNAEAKVKVMKTDLQAWSKVKQYYLKE